MQNNIDVFPAPAGINRDNVPASGGKICVPRASGDKPLFAQIGNVVGVCSPRQRG
ncbi:hypothetical protein HMI78_001958 [Salmonella enterica]|nr:hypothetical protein [Salmonella enterica]